MIPKLPVSNLLSKLTANSHVFIADLHLSEQSIYLLDAFHQLLTVIENSKINSLYILGDWFNVWLGDDDTHTIESAWLTQITEQLKAISKVTHIYFCSGNRDFLLKHRFLNSFGGILLNDVSYLNIHNTRIRLEHGDLLCTDDVDYLKFRKIIRHPFTVKLFDLQPQKVKQHIADKLRQKSSSSTAMKQTNIMDVNSIAVNEAVKNIDILVHGHTHRPNIHTLPNNKYRYVLGDWRVQTPKQNSQALSNYINKTSAVIGVLVDAGKFELLNIHF